MNPFLSLDSSISTQLDAFPSGRKPSNLLLTRGREREKVSSCSRRDGGTCRRVLRSSFFVLRRPSLFFLDAVRVEINYSARQCRRIVASSSAQGHSLACSLDSTGEVDRNRRIGELTSPERAPDKSQRCSSTRLAFSCRLIAI